MRSLFLRALSTSIVDVFYHHVFVFYIVLDFGFLVLMVLITWTELAFAISIPDDFSSYDLRPRIHQ